VSVTAEPPPPLQSLWHLKMRHPRRREVAAAGQPWLCGARRSKGGHGFARDVRSVESWNVRAEIGTKTHTHGVDGAFFLPHLPQMTRPQSRQ
jgi:hypothetical protein